MQKSNFVYVANYQLTKVLYGRTSEEFRQKNGVGVCNRFIIKHTFCVIRKHSYWMPGDWHKFTVAWLRDSMQPS